jgi:geranylgeranyl reductase
MEIAIIGGGPAGAVASARLAGAGQSVTLYHDEARPEKPCGGGVPWRALMRAPVLQDPALPRRVVSRLVIVAPSGRTAEIDLDRPLHLFSRARLDGFLRAKAVEAGARLVPHRVRRIERGASGGFLLVHGDGERRTFDRIAGADGAGSLVRRTFLGRRPVSALSQAVGFYVHGVTDDRAIIRFERGLNGYQWSFPRLDHLAAGICAPLSAARPAALWERCRRFVADLPGGPGGEAVRREPYAALIPAPVWDRSGRMVVESDGWALLGDAAGAVDPLTRQGIHYAMESALLWADAILDPAGGSYRERFHAAFPRELVPAQRYADRFFDPAFTEKIVRYAEISTAVRALLRDLVAGVQPYITLKRKLLVTAVPLSLSLLARRLSPCPARRQRSSHLSDQRQGSMT